MPVWISVLNTMNAKWYVLLIVRLIGSRSIEVDNFNCKVIIKTLFGKQYFMGKYGED